MSRHRWNLETCTPLHERWMAGETLVDLASEIAAHPHALSRAFIHHGLPTPYSSEHVLATRLRVREAPTPGRCRIDLCPRLGGYRGLCERHYKTARRFAVLEAVAAPSKSKVGWTP